MIRRLEKPVIAAFIIVDLLIIVSCLLVLYLGVPRPGGKQLCQDLGVHDETLCATGSNISRLLDVAFEPGVTRRQEVRGALADYLIEEHERPAGGVAETYRLEWTPLGATRAYFSFDSADVLISITIED